MNGQEHLGVPSLSSPLFRFLEKAGRHAVGLKVVEQYDYSRTYRHSTDELGKPYQAERSRPLQTLIWYPAKLTGVAPMTVGDYGELLATETSFGRPKMSAYAKETLSGMSPTLAMPLWAVHDAPLASGRFPVVVYAPSFSAPSWENADLCEYLASHGYLVLASPNMGAATRNMTNDVAGINAQARDISFLIGYAQTLSNADLSAIAVAGFSWGGISNLFAAARDNRIGALIALDGSLRFSPGLVKQSGDVHPAQMTIPLLSFGHRYFSFEEQDRYLTHIERDGPSVLNAWTHGDLIHVHMLGLTHEEYSSMSQRNEDMWGKLFQEFPMLKADYDREDGITGYAWMARYALQFLNAYLKHDAVAMAFIKKTPAENGVPRHVMALDYRAGTGVPVSFDGFRTEVGRQGFDRTAEIYAEMQRHKSDFKLDQGALNSWADELISENYMHEAIALLKLNVKMYPDASGAYMSLAVAQQKSGQTQLAIENYQRALERDPTNTVIRKKLGELLPHGAPGARENRSEM